MALPRILTVDNGKVVLTEEILSIPEFNALWQHCLDLLPFQFIWARYDSESPYLNLDEETMEEEILKDYPVHSYLNELEMIAAMEKAEKLYFSPVRKILRGTKTAVEKYVNYFSEMTLEAGRDGNLSAVKAAIVDMPKMIKSYQEAEQAYKSEIQRNRGDVKSAIDEDFDGDYD